MLTQKLTVKEYARLEGVSTRTIWRRIKAKRVKAKLENGKMYVFVKGATEDLKNKKLASDTASYFVKLSERYESEIRELKQENQEYRQELKDMRKDLRELTQGVTKALQQSQFIQGLSLTEGKSNEKNTKPIKKRNMLSWLFRKD